jgi:hypothetical protein
MGVKLRLASIFAVLALLSALVIAPMGASAQTGAAQTLTNVPTTVGGVSGFLNGTLNVTRVANQGGQLVAIGTLTGTITSEANAAGTTLATLTNQAVTVPVTGVTGTCSILTLHLGPIHLDLLGLVVDVSPIDLNITAQQGSGNLLGNLLCAVAHLLDNPNGAPVNALVAQLNHILNTL